MVTYVQPTLAGFVTFHFCTINSKYFQRLDLLRSFLSLGLGYFAGKVLGSIRYKSLSLGLGFLNKGHAVSQSLGLTILYP